MNYYIAYEQKKDFYLLGQLTPTSFHEGHAYKFLKEYISEFPGLMHEISVSDEIGNKLTLSEFFEKIKK